MPIFLTSILIFCLLAAGASKDRRCDAVVAAHGDVMLQRLTARTPSDSRLLIRQAVGVSDDAISDDGDAPHDIKVPSIERGPVALDVAQPQELGVPIPSLDIEARPRGDDVHAPDDIDLLSIERGPVARDVAQPRELLLVPAAAFAQPLCVLVLAISVLVRSLAVHRYHGYGRIADVMARQAEEPLTSQKKIDMVDAALAGKSKFEQAMKEDRPAAMVEGAPCTDRCPSVGDVVVRAGRKDVMADAQNGTSNGWTLQCGEVATVVHIDSSESFRFQLRNARGAVSAFVPRRLYAFAVNEWERVTPLEARAYVEVTRPFISNGETKLELKQGLCGKVLETDEVNNAKVDFVGINTYQWLCFRNLDNLTVLEPEPKPPRTEMTFAVKSILRELDQRQRQRSVSWSEGSEARDVESVEAPPKCEERGLYLPEFKGPKLVLVPQQAPDTYLVDQGLYYRRSMDMADADPFQFADRGSIVTGELSDGWLKVRVPDGDVLAKEPLATSESDMDRFLEAARTALSVDDAGERHREAEVDNFIEAANAAFRDADGSNGPHAKKSVLELDRFIQAANVTLVGAAVKVGPSQLRGSDLCQGATYSVDSLQESGKTLMEIREHEGSCFSACFARFLCGGRRELWMDVRTTEPEVAGDDRFWEFHLRKPFHCASLGFPATVDVFDAEWSHLGRVEGPLAPLCVASPFRLTASRGSKPLIVLEGPRCQVGLCCPCLGSAEITGGGTSVPSRRHARLRRQPAMPTCCWRPTVEVDFGVLASREEKALLIAASFLLDKEVTWLDTLIDICWVIIYMTGYWYLVFIPHLYSIEH